MTASVAPTKLVSFIKKTIPVLCGVLLTSILFFPHISIGESYPKIELVDLVLPVLGLVILALYKELTQKRFLFLTLGFGGFIFLTMVINSRLGHKSDYFEIYKIIKFVVLIGLFSFVQYESFFKNWIKPIFIGLVIVNIIHYFNLFDINLLIQKVYFSSYNYYAEFGLNSAGAPHSKRMLGLVANPNNNAIIFAIFAILFIPKKELSIKSAIWFMVALIMMFLCQSRTAMLALPVILVAYGFLAGVRHLKQTAGLIGLSILSFGISYLITVKSIGVGTPPNMELIHEFVEKNPSVYWDETRQELRLKKEGTKQSYTYLESVIHGQFTEGTSMMGRYEIWRHLWKMIQEKPFFGYGPDKEYFYEHEYYAENEFIFMAWRYGFIGLIFFLVLMTFLAVKAIANRHLDSAQNLLFVLILYGITALTNLPFSAITLNMLLAVIVGLFFSQLRNKDNFGAQTT